MRFLGDQCGFLFEPGGFRIVDSRTSTSNGGSALVVLESKTLRMRVAWERAELLLEFQPLAGRQSEWYSLGLLRGVLLGDRGASEALDPSWATFLHESLNDLESRLSRPDTASEMVRALKQQARLRAKELFG